MAFDNLSDREKQVLFNLVNHYIQNADPVGSRVIANRFAMGLSSATIRNTLQDLEELGLVEQPHTSAGRRPTDEGYRFYVDYLLKPEKLTAREQKLIKEILVKQGRGINEMLGQTARLLGEVTHQLGVSVAPRFESGRLKNIHLISLAEDRIMVVVVLKSGLARSLVLEVQAKIDDSELYAVEAALNEKLAGLTLAEIRDSLSDRLESISGHGRLIKLVIDSRDKIWTDNTPAGLHIAGADHLLTMPEFADRERLGQLLKMLEDGKILQEFISSDDQEGLLITIGKENRFDEIMKCSMVTATYRVGNVTGKIGIIGPTRMPYSKLVSVVEYTARSITEVISGMETDKDA
jgi:heat-inducible transcriptional repressor